MDFRQTVEAIIPDAQGRIVATLARTTRELSLSALAELSGVSLAHVARIVPRLVELGIVERHDVPPAVLVKLVPEHLASRAILLLADLRHTFLEELRDSARRLDPAPVNVTLFGSFARAEDDAESDVDVLVVRPSSVNEDDSIWADSIARWEAHVQRISGNAVNRIEVGEDEVAKLMKSRRPLWQEIRRGASSSRAHPSSTSERRNVPRESRTRRVTPAQARSYLGKAEEFLVAARQSLDAGYTLAATSLAVHAGISAGDAICGARTGRRAAGATTRREPRCSRKRDARARTRRVCSPDSCR